MARYQATINIGRFVPRTEPGPNNLPIRNFLPSDLAAQGIQVFGRTSEMIAFFSTIFGPYPFEAYGVVVPAADLGFALETQTLSVFGRDVVEALGNDGSATIVAHELAHQWYGNSVSVQNWRDIWLAEGFATYAEWLWLEHTQGSAVLEDIVRNAYEAAAEQRLPPPANPPPDDLFNGAVYGRGALTLAALRLRVGSDVFFRILRTYSERYRDGNASTRDFIAVAEEISQRDLQSFFEGWLYATEVPGIPELGLPAGK